MVKPLNKEWELFGNKYRVPGAKGEKVDCSACHKQVSAAVNRLQSHLRICPAQPNLSPALAAQIQLHHPSRSRRQESGSASEDESHVNTGGMTRNMGENGLTTQNMKSIDDPDAKRQRTSISQQRWNSIAPQTDENSLWLTSPSAGTSLAYTKRRLEIEEKRLQLELQRAEREERRELYHLEILQSQARKERLAADKEAYEARVLLALTRRQLRDQGISEEEIDRMLPVEPLELAVPTPAISTDLTTSEIAEGNIVEENLYNK